MFIQVGGCFAPIKNSNTPRSINFNPLKPSGYFMSHQV